MIGGDDVSVTGALRAATRCRSSEAALADLTRPAALRPATQASPPGEVPERLNGRDWKSRNGG